MGYQGSSRKKIEELSGIGKLEELTHKKRVRWAASVYERNEPELLPRARRILEEELGIDSRLVWMEGKEPGKEARVVQASDGLEERQRTGEVIGYTDGSRMGGGSSRSVGRREHLPGNICNGHGCGDGGDSGSVGGGIHHGGNRQSGGH